MKRLFRSHATTTLLTLLTIALAGAVPALAAPPGTGGVTITQADVTKGSIPGTNGTSGFPVTITKSGSYRLGSNLDVPGGVDAIDIDAPDVTLDLNGLAVRGPVTCTGKGASLSCSGFVSGGIAGILSHKGNVTVRNGTVRGFSTIGLFLDGTGSVADSINASDNFEGGISLSDGRVTKCTATRNGAAEGFYGFGIAAGASQLTGNTSMFNRFDGFELLQSGATDNVSVGNGLWGYAGSQSLVSNSVSAGNYGDIFNQGGLTSVNNNCSGSGC